MGDRGEPVLFRRRDGAGWITLNRPAKLNALDRASLSRLAEVLAEAVADPSLRVLVVTGAGRAFCAGADLDEVSGSGRDDYLDRLHGALGALRAFPRPVVGVLNGLTAAGGLELALCCDLLVAAQTARIADGHVTYGLVPGAGGATILPRRIGLQRAKQMLFTGEFEPASTLRDWGLINWVVADDRLDPFVTDLVRRLAGLSPDALRAMKALANAATSPDLLAREAAAMRVHLGSPDATEGLSAFREKRRPDFG